MPEQSTSVGDKKNTAQPNPPNGRGDEDSTARDTDQPDQPTVREMPPIRRRSTYPLDKWAPLVSAKRANHNARPTPHNPVSHPQASGSSSTANTDGEVPDKGLQTDAKKLRTLLELYFNLAFNLKGDTWHFNLVVCFVFLVQIVKVAVLTRQMFDFGNDRRIFSSVVNRGDLVLRHLLLENWDASRETLPYPPAHGEFAVYKIDDLESGINYAVRNYHNAERESIGSYIRTEEDTMTASVKYFDLPGFDDKDGENPEDELTISEITFPIDKGLTKVETEEKQTMYNYDIALEFDQYNLSRPIKRMLSTTLHFKLHSLRSHERSRKATCLRVEGSVHFQNHDNNGQVSLDLKTKFSRIKCKDMNISISDWQLEKTYEIIGISVIVLTTMSLILTLGTIIFVIYTCYKTKMFMKKHFKNYYNVGKESKEVDLSTSEYLRFMKVWELTVILSDIFTLYGTVRIVFYTVNSEWELELLDSYIVWLGVGCALSWASLLKYLKFNKKFHLLFTTIHKAFWNVIAYLLCVSVLFVGFWACGYVVMGPYHVKFETPAAAAETLFALVNGDEIYTTLAILESDKSGGEWVTWFSRIYIVAYVALFTIVGFNLLIALFLSAYKSIQDYKEKKQDERYYSTMEMALRRVIEERKEGNIIRSAIWKLMKKSKELSPKEHSLIAELAKIVYITQTEDDVVLCKPKTLKALFIEDEEHKCKVYKLGPFKCVFACIPGCEQRREDESNGNTH